MLLTFLLLLAGAPAWVTFTAPDGTFTIRFPDQAPIKWDRPTSKIWTTLNRQNQYMVQEFSAERYRADKADEVLRDYPNVRAAGIEGQVVESRTVTLGPYTGREVRMEGVSGPAHLPVVSIERAFVTDGHLYVVSVHSAKGRPIDKELADAFFNSFQLLK